MTIAYAAQMVIPSHVYAEEDDEGYVPREECTDEDVKEIKKNKENEEKKSEDVVVEGGDWTKKGTKEYKNAEELYSVLVNEYGTSSAFAIGVLANVARESGFTADIKEIEGGQNYSGRGGGLFQFTPMEKYLNSKEAKQNKDKWAVESQVAYVWNSEFKNRAIEPYLNGKTGRSAGVGLYGIPPIAKDIEELISTDDVEKATQGFYAGYERGRDFHPDMEKSKKHAAIAEKLFAQDKKDADESKWKLEGHKGNRDTHVYTKEEKEEKSIESPDKEKEKVCKVKLNDKEKNEDEGTAKWGGDGKGKHGISLNGMKFYKPDELPKSLKEYALDPKVVGLGWHKSTGWKGGGMPQNDQCTNLSSSFFGNLWRTKDNKELDWSKLQNTGNGVVTASVFADTFGGKTTSKPSKGAVFSAPQGTPVGGDTHYGHTGIVSHVFENGDVLIVEQNIPGYSGNLNGEAMNWNYRLIPKDSLKGTSYFNPSTIGFKPNEKISK
ncbi:phage tail tip lysozyme [Staphylococcus agnetis]|uniref:phage tail tip lysozyme n=1 Tax=Staphylococcus agnetis TaxID=985762 RepID=UPI00208F10B9|nr:phage tail tip lysozyme [Staphylococcus agnetis]MCO4346306.1 phage tail tip lysozyme [Staphylococcus agnetis]MCO4360618.1 phage tail tip lysozyme [Staphylococcus agnetis]